MDYTMHVWTDFVECMERSLLCRQVPEYQWKGRKINNSEDDPVLGHVVDIVYKISMPVIVKSEKVDDKDDDLVLLGVTPGCLMSRVPMNITVKKEKNWQYPRVSGNKDAVTVCEFSFQEQSTRDGWIIAEY